MSLRKDFEFLNSVELGKSVGTFEVESNAFWIITYLWAHGGQG